MIKGEGQLVHHFWGDYCCDIVIRFDTAAEAETVLESGLLGEHWSQSAKDDFAIVALRINRDQLETIKDALEAQGADRRKIDSVARSIDYGEPFEIRMDLDPRQQSLPLE